MTPDDALLERVRELGGFDTPREAEIALRATLAGLGEALHENDRLAVADALPDRFVTTVCMRRDLGSFDVDVLVERVGLREGVAPGFALEHAQAACRALGEVLPDDLVHRLDGVLPPAFAGLFHRVSKPE